ncbi:efflux RND transporter periplasmic adaptor subunit [Fulvivirga sp.]|uniref:efflux RND transporter periplasmic adaptor subunit n=1 Tax=Fulvivirga sp. TaxID=1931237 RepID=UPI0032ED7699
MANKTKNVIKNKAFNYLIAASLLILSSCSSKTDTEISVEGETQSIIEDAYHLTTNQFLSSKMAFGRMVPGSFHEVVKANGMFDVPPENRAYVSCYFGGIVKDIRLLPGERVKKGQVLFTLENPDYVQMQQDFLEAKGQLVYLKSDYERQKNLAQDNVTSQKNYIKSESDYTVTKVKVESLSKKLGLMNINPNTLTLENMRTTIIVMSPISGYVTEVAISRGAFLNPSELAVSIVDTDHLHLELNIFEKDLSKVKIGQQIQFRTQGDESNFKQATVYLVNKTVDAEKRTIGIHGHLSDEKPADTFNPGMYVEAEIYTSTSSKMSLPQDAIVDIDGKYYVLVLQDSIGDSYNFIKKEVKTGLSNNSQVEILNAYDFKEDTEFLVKGAFNLIKE